MELLLETACEIGRTAISKFEGDRFHGEVRRAQELCRRRQPFLLGVFPNTQSPGKFEQSSCMGARNVELELSAGVFQIQTDATIVAVDKVCQLRNPLVAVIPRHGNIGEQAVKKVIETALILDCWRFVVHGIALSRQDFALVNSWVVLSS